MAEKTSGGVTFELVLSKNVRQRWLKPTTGLCRRMQRAMLEVIRTTTRKHRQSLCTSFNMRVVSSVSTMVQAILFVLEAGDTLLPLPRPRQRLRNIHALICFE